MLGNFGDVDCLCFGCCVFVCFYDCDYDVMVFVEYLLFFGEYFVGFVDVGCGFE